MVGREMNCVRTGESWYLADDGGGERELRLRWLKTGKRVLRPLSVHSASWWTQALGGWESLCSALGSQ